jgi:hypothetical protein
VNQPRFWLCGLARLQHGRIAKRRLLCLYYACALRCCAAAESMIAPASARGIRCGIVVGAHHVGKTGIPASARHLLHRPYLCDWRWTCPARSDLGCLLENYRPWQMLHLLFMNHPAIGLSRKSHSPSSRNDRSSATASRATGFR